MALFRHFRDRQLTISLPPPPPLLSAPLLSRYELPREFTDARLPLVCLPRLPFPLRPSSSSGLSLDQNFDHLFKANNPLTAEGKPHSSHYLQSKVVRAKERIEAEIASGRKGGEAAESAAAEGGRVEGKQ